MAEGLQAVSDRPLTMVLDGKPTPVSKLRPADWAEAESYVRSIRRREYQKDMPVNPAMNPINIAVLARIQLERISDLDILADWHGRVKLVQLALRRANPSLQVSETEVGQKLDSSEPSFFDTLAAISGMYAETEEVSSDDRNPT